MKPGNRPVTILAVARILFSASRENIPIANGDLSTRDSRQSEFRVFVSADADSEVSRSASANPNWLDGFGNRLGSFAVLSDGSMDIDLQDVGRYFVRPDLSVSVRPSEPADSETVLAQFWHAVAPFVLEARGWGCLHAGGAALDGHVAAFCGPSGRGKSTLAYSFGRRWDQRYADDALPFLVTEQTILAARLPQAPSLRRTARQSLTPFETRSAARPDRFDVAATIIPLACVYWLDGMTDSPAAPLIATERIPATEAFQLLLSEAHASPIEDAAAKRRVVENYLKLTAGVPTYRLRFQAGFDRYDAVLDEIEKHFRELVNPTS